MAQTAQEAHGENRIWVTHPLPRFMSWLAILLTLGFTTLTFSLLAGMRAGDLLLHPNPFLAYEALWPGQSIENVAEVLRNTPDASVSCVTWFATSKFHPSGTGKTNASAGKEMTCTKMSKEGVFSAMNLSVENGQVQVLQLTSKILQQDALFLFWGAPDVVKQNRSHQSWVLQWNRSSYSATAFVRETDSIVVAVTLLNKGAACSTMTVY